MKDGPKAARRFVFMIEIGKLKATRQTGDDSVVLQPWSNKYVLIGKDRIVQVLMVLHPDEDQQFFDDMRLEDLKVLIQWVLMLDEN